MKNNKGYTLVELLVAMAIFAIIMAEIGTMMNHSSKLYLNGTYEVDLQTEAQQIVQQMEELLIDASVSVNVTPNASGLSVNNIEIVNYDSSYRIVYVQPDPSVSYGNIYLTSTGSYTADNQLMGEYVESISLNMAEYASASKITLEVLLRNDKYTYATSKDIYLRNDIGLSGNRATPSTEGEFRFELDVLRFKEYDLGALYNDKGGNEGASDYYPEKNYIYRLKGSDGSYIDYNSQYSLINNKLNTENYFNGNYRNEGEGIVDALDPETGARVFSIKISTDEVKIGADGYGLFYGYYTSLKITSPVHVSGIYLGAAESIDWSVQIQDPVNNPAPLREQTLSPSDTYDAGGTSYIFPEGYMRMDTLKARIRDDWNSLYFTGERIMDCQNYYNAIANNGMFKVVAVFHYSGGYDTITVNSYLYPMMGSEMSDAVANAFWSNCR